MPSSLLYLGTFERFFNGIVIDLNQIILNGSYIAFPDYINAIVVLWCYNIGLYSVTVFFTWGGFT